MDTKWATTELAWTSHPETGVSFMCSLIPLAQRRKKPRKSQQQDLRSNRDLQGFLVIAQYVSRTRQDAPLREQREKKKKIRRNPISAARPAADVPSPPASACLKREKKKCHFPHKVAFKKAKILLCGDPLHSQASKSTPHKVPVTASSCFPMWSTQWPKEEQKES